MGEERFGIGTDFAPASVEDWRARVERELGGDPFDKLRKRTEDDIPVEPLYTREADLGADAAGFPGLPPYLRGTHPLGVVGRGWEVCNEHDVPTVEECAQGITADLERGATSVWIRVGLDHGTRVLTAGDIARLLEAVDLQTTPIYLESAQEALPLAAALVAVCRSRELEPGVLRGGFGADPLGVLARTGSLHSGLRGAMAEARDLVAWSRHNAPGMRALLVSGVPYADAGATPVQQLGWTIASGVDYLRRLSDAGFSVDEVAGQMRFAFAMGSDFFVEVAKLRAARLVWAKTIRACGGSEDAAAMAVHATCSWHTKTQRDPWVNIVRGTAESFAAVVGGADAIATRPFDSAVGPSDDRARRIARNTQLVLREEAELHRTVDPAGGSWYVETLTDRLARAAWAEMQRIEAGGGMGQALVRGYVRERLEQTRTDKERAVATRKAPVVGVNEYPNLDEERLERSMPDAETVEQQVGRALGTGDVRNRYDALVSLAKKAGGQEPSAPGDLTAQAVEAAGVGVDAYSLSQVLRSGRASLHVPPLTGWRAAEAWERLRDASDAFVGIKGRRPRAFLANLGSIPEHRARADFAYNLFAAAGIEPVTNDGFESAEQAARAFAESGADLAVVCGNDERYAQMGAAVAEGLRAHAPSRMVLMGDPGNHRDALEKAGVDTFVRKGDDVLSVLCSIQDELGVST